MDSSTVDSVTREQWLRGGFATNSGRLPKIIGQKFMNRFPKEIDRKSPFNAPELNGVLNHFADENQPVLCKLFLPVRHLRLGFTAGRLIRKLTKQALVAQFNPRLVKKSMKPRRTLLRSVLSMLCKPWANLEAFNKVVKAGDSAKLWERLCRKGRQRGVTTLTSLSQARWMIE